MFKKIGKGIKKAAGKLKKAVSIKNIAKVAAVALPIAAPLALPALGGILGGISKLPGLGGISKLVTGAVDKAKNLAGSVSDAVKGFTTAFTGSADATATGTEQAIGADVLPFKLPGGNRTLLYAAVAAAVWGIWKFVMPALGMRRRTRGVF